MYQQVTRASRTGPTTGAGENASQYAQDILSRLKQLCAFSGETAQLAGKMLAFLGSADTASSRVMIGQLDTLFQSTGYDAKLLNAGLQQLLGQFAPAEGAEFVSIKNLARWLGAQPGTQGDKQSAALLRQLSQGHLNEAIGQQLRQAVAQLRQSGEPLTQKSVGTELQTLLQHIRQELGQTKQAELLKPLAEFALRLNQQAASDDAGRLALSGWWVGERQGNSQQRHQQQQQQELAEEDITTNRVRPRSLNVGYTSEAQSTGQGYSLINGDDLFAYGLTILYMFMDTLSSLANGQFADMEASSEQAREVQELSTLVDSQIADIAATGDAEATCPLNAGVQQYVEQNNLTISGVYENGKWADGKPGSCTSGDLKAIQGALDKVANNATDFVSTAQLQLQKMMQTYNVCTSLINSMQTLLADMNKTIAQGIR